MGFFAYHAVPGNGRATMAFRFHVTTLWWRALVRRSQRGRLTWARAERLFQRLASTAKDSASVASRTL